MNDVAPSTRVPRRVKLRVEDFLMLDGGGAFDAYGRTELLDGEVVYMNAQHRPHARIKSRLFGLLRDGLHEAGLALEALVEGSVAMPPHNVPEPDIALTTDADGEGLIPLASLALIVEVADTTLRNDLGRKQRIYAQAQIPEYWVVDINDRIIHQMWQPVGVAYAQRRAVVFGDTLAAATLPSLVVATTTL